MGYCLGKGIVGNISEGEIFQPIPQKANLQKFVKQSVIPNSKVIVEDIIDKDANFKALLSFNGSKYISNMSNL